MKFFVAFVALVAVAVANPITRPTTSDDAAVAEIIAAISSPNTDPATAELLEAMLQDILGAEPVQVGPAIIDHEIPDISPAIIDFPLPEGALEPTPIYDGGAVTAPSPVVIGPLAPGAPAPLVQLIVNINKGPAGSSPIDITPVVVGPAAEPTLPVNVVEQAFEPVEVVDVMPVSPVEVVDVMPVAPVEIVDVMPVSPVHVVDVAPVSPVIIGTPVFPSPAVVLPEELN